MNTYEKEFGKWYGTYTNPGSFGTSALNNFVKNGLSIFSRISANGEKPPVIVLTSEIDTASADIANNKIYLTTKNLFESKVEGFLEKSIVLVYNGYMAHEAAHFKYTKIPLTEIHKHVDGFSYKNPLKNFIYQIVEDLFIDNQNMMNLSTFQSFMNAASDFSFNPVHFETVVQSLKPIEDFESIGNFLNLIACYKNLSLRYEINNIVSDDDFMKSVLDKFCLSMETYDQVNRVELALEIYKLFEEKVPELKDKEEEEIEEGFSIGGAEDNNDSETGDESKSDEKIILMIDSSLAVEDGGYEGIEIQPDFEASFSKASDSSETKEHVGVFEISVNKTLLDEIKETENWGDYPFKIEPDLKLNQLEKLIKARSEINRYKGMPKRSGVRLNQLHRIATDQKVFSDTIKVQGLGRQEVIVLVDMSGSMVYSDYANQALEEAYGIARNLENAKHLVSVYGHSADCHLPQFFENSSGTTFVYELKSFSELADNLLMFDESYPYELYANNADGYAIEHVSKKFTEERNRKSLIVISDGAPSANVYGSTKVGIRHTKGEVEKVRAKGINVISLSISPSCVADNNEIYGESFNVACATENVAEIVMNMILKNG